MPQTTALPHDTELTPEAREYIGADKIRVTLKTSTGETVSYTLSTASLDRRQGVPSAVRVALHNVFRLASRPKMHRLYESTMTRAGGHEHGWNVCVVARGLLDPWSSARRVSLTAAAIAIRSCF